MNHTTHHCSLCGKNTDATRNNGWVGAASLSLKWNGNGGSKDLEDERLCFSCGREVADKVKELKREFTVKTVVEYSSEPDEQ